MRKMKLGDTVVVREPPAYDPEAVIRVIGWDKYGPILAPLTARRLVVLDTQEKVDQYNKENKHEDS